MSLYLGDQIISGPIGVSLQTIETMLLNYQLINQPINTLATSGIVALGDNSVNYISPSDAVTFTLPTVVGTTTFHQILIQVNMSTVYTIDLGTSNYFGGSTPSMSSIGYYDIIYEYDAAIGDWVVGVLSKS